MIPSALAPALGLEQLDLTSDASQPRPGQSIDGASFGDELTTAVADAQETREQEAAQAQVPGLLKLIMLLEMLGLPIPKSMIATLRTAGLTGMADQLEAYNRRLEKQQQEGRPLRVAA